MPDKSVAISRTCISQGPDQGAVPQSAFKANFASYPESVGEQQSGPINEATVADVPAFAQKMDALLDSTADALAAEWDLRMDSIPGGGGLRPDRMTAFRRVLPSVLVQPPNSFSNSRRCRCTRSTNSPDTDGLPPYFFARSKATRFRSSQMSAGRLMPVVL